MKTKKRFFGILISLALVLGLFPGMSLTAYAAGVNYVDGSGKSQTADATELEATTTNWTDGSWYIVPADGLTIGDRITVNGTVNLILRDDVTLTASVGITTTNATLNIYAQSAGTGTLTAKGSNGNSNGGSAGIGGCGGAYGSSGGAGGTVSIFGGTVTATGGNSGAGGAGAGIGGGGAGLGMGNTGGAGGTVSIFGGTVTATGGTANRGAGAGIGGGGKDMRGSAGASGTLTLGKGVKLYNGTDNTGTVLDDSDSTERSYSGSRPQNMFAEFISAGSVDKTALNAAITAAETLYNSIKDNTDYADIASTLQTAINTAKAVAESSEAGQDDVDVAASAIGTAKTTAEAGIKDVDDTKAANAVIAKINALPASTAVTTENREAIEAARAAYDALTDDQKAKVNTDILTKLTEAETALSTIDQTEAGNVTTAINNLPAANDVTIANRADIAAARAAYNALDDAQKALVSAETLQKLTDAESALTTIDQTAAGNVATLINNLPAATDVTTANKEAIEAARAAYDALDDAQKALVDADTLKKLTDAEAALKEAVDTATAQEVTDTISALPDFSNVTADNKTAIEAARAAYDALTDDEKAKVSADTLKKLTDAEEKLVVLQVMSEVSAKTGSGMTYTGNPIQLINTPTTSLPDGYTMKYAVTTENTAPTDDNLYTTSIPSKTDAGTYYVWYKAVGDETHTDSEAKCITVTISSESSGGSGGSSSSGGGSSTPSTPTTPTESYTVPVSSENTVNVTTNISNGTAVVSEITQSDIDKIVDNGNNSGGGDNTGASENTSITIDVSQAKSEVTSVQLSEKTVEKLTEAVKADNNVESVKIKMTNATIELDGAALSAVSEQAEGSSIKLVVEDTQTTKLNATQQESLKQFASAKPFQAYFESNGKEIHDFKGGKATVSIKFSPESGRDVKHYHMYYLPVAGAIERYVTRYVDGMLSFVTTHFSDYAIVYDETMENETGKDDGTGGGSSETGGESNGNTDGAGTDSESENGSQTDSSSGNTANGKTSYQNALSINKGLKVSQTGNKITVSWGKVSGANRYEIYVAYCTGKFGKTPVKVVTKKGVTSVTITKLNGKKLKLTKNFKVYVAAYKIVDGVKKNLGKTITAHIVGRKNKTYTNVKAIKLAKNKATIKVGKTYKIKASVVLVDSKKKMLSDKHAATFRYASSNKKIAAVDKNGKVIAKKKGTCYVWIYAKNGYANKVKVTVK